MKLLLAGYFGSGNIGDEAILQVLVSELKKSFPYGSITALSADPDGTSASYDISSVHKYSVLSVLKELAFCNAFVLGGGGLLQDATSARSLFYYSSLIFLAKLFGKKTVLIAQGIGPIRNRALLKSAMKNVDLVTVRDERSLKELTGIGAAPYKLALTADLSFLLGKPDRENGKKLLEVDGIQKCRSRLIGMAIRPPVKGKDAASRYKAIAALCDHMIKEKDSQIVFLIFKYPDDTDAIEQVMSFMEYSAHILFRRCTPAEMLDVISALDGLIGMRLHSLIFASMAGIPGFGLSYDPKVESFQRSLGLKWSDLDGLKGADIQAAVGGFIDGLGAGAQSVERFTMAAEENISLMDRLLKNDRVRVLGVEIDNITMEDAVKKAEDLIASKSSGLIVTPNPEMIMYAQKDVELTRIVNGAYLSIADGVGLMMAGRLLGKRFRQRIAGIDMMLKLVDISRAKGYRIFLFGSREGVADDAAKAMKTNVVGTFHGYSRNDHLAADRIKEAKPDMLFIGLGSPAQEKWAAKYLKEIDVPLVMCVGGSFDVIAGRVRRAPMFMRRAGLEWFWRLIQEPSRWKRMLVLPKFILRVTFSK
jgi:polysaccharide pyruvyl transferase CsaB